MKRIFYICFVWVLTSNLRAQDDTLKINSCLVYLLDSNTINNNSIQLDSIYSSMNYLNYEVSKLIYKYSTSFIERYSIEISNVVEKWLFHPTKDSIQGKVKQLYFNNLYLIESQDFLNLTSSVLIDSLIKKKSNFLLSKELKNYSVEFILGKISEFADFEMKIYLFSLINSRLNIDDLVEFYLNNKIQLRSNLEIYKTILFRISQSGFKNNLDIREDELNFINSLNLSQSDNSEFKNSLNGIIIDSIRIKVESSRGSVTDSMRQEIYKNSSWTSKNDTVNISEADYYLNQSSRTFEENREYRIKLDTTLQLDISQPTPIFIGDDGTRFDTLSNDSLVRMLFEYNPSEIYINLISPIDFNSNNRVIYLRKIMQILGDRYHYNSNSISVSQRVIIDNWIEFYKQKLCNDTIFGMRMESFDQLERLWGLLFPKFIPWIVEVDSCSSEYIFIYSKLDLMIDESSIIELISIGDAASLNNENIKLINIGYFLSNIWANLTSEVDLPYRRFKKDLVVSQSWVDNYIYPALKRWNHSGIK